jgi:hypothetical protein
VRPTVCLLGGSSKPWASTTTSQPQPRSLPLDCVSYDTVDRVPVIRACDERELCSNGGLVALPAPEMGQAGPTTSSVQLGAR